MFNKKILAAVTTVLLCTTVATGTALAADGAALYIEKTCIACHGAEGKLPAMDAYPKLAGQHEPYIMVQMQLIRDEVRTNSHAAAMKNIMHMVTDEEMAAIAKYLAGMK